MTTSPGSLTLHLPHHGPTRQSEWYLSLTARLDTFPPLGSTEIEALMRVGRKMNSLPRVATHAPWYRQHDKR